jgi:hypothetical protein
MIKTDVFAKTPFGRITSAKYLKGSIVSDLNTAAYPIEAQQWQTLSQSDFLREYYPWGHKINSEVFYPDRIRFSEGADGHKNFYRQRISRVAMPFQMIITAQHLVHLCGNNIQFELTDAKEDEEHSDLFLQATRGWLEKNMEVRFYEFARSVKITGDGAIVFYLYNGKLYTKTLSFMDGDTLYPHYNEITGRLDTFARRYFTYSERHKTEWVEVWDEKNMYVYRKQKGSAGLDAISWIAPDSLDGLEGYDLLSSQPHGFDSVPVAYHRDKHGSCWTFAQDSIDNYELALSNLTQNNAAYAFPIMILKGDDVEIQGDMYGAVKAISMGKDDDASYLDRPDVTGAFTLQLETLLKMIFLGSFTVVPPEVKSGDLPGVAIKLIYSPSLERAMLDAKDFKTPLNDIVRLFLYGYGVETKQLTKFYNFWVFPTIKPYIHQNNAELINNLVQSVNSGVLSRHTASELSGYGKNDEWDRLMIEKKQEETADLLYQLDNKE